MLFYLIAEPFFDQHHLFYGDNFYSILKSMNKWCPLRIYQVNLMWTFLLWNFSTLNFSTFSTFSIFTNSTFSFWSTKSKQKHESGKTSKISQLNANVHSHNYVGAIKTIIKSTINCKNQGKEPSRLLRIVTVYSLFEESNTVWYLVFKYRICTFVQLDI